MIMASGGTSLCGAASFPCNAAAAARLLGSNITSYLPKPLSLLDVITYLSSSSTISPNTNPW